MQPTQMRALMNSPIVCCEADDSLQTVARRMREEDTGFIPLMRQGQLVGVVTDRDVVTRAVAEGVDLAQARAYDYCSLSVETIEADASIEDAVRLMEARRIRRLIVTEGGAPVGVVSLGDLAESLPDEAEAVLVELSKSAKTLAHGGEA